MDTLGNPYGSDISTAGGFLDADELRKGAIMYSADAPIQTLIDYKGVKV